MLSSDLVLDDPGVFWDEEAHQAYLICNTASSKQKSPDNTRFQEMKTESIKMSWDGKEHYWIQDNWCIRAWVQKQLKSIA